MEQHVKKKSGLTKKTKKCYHTTNFSNNTIYILVIIFGYPNPKPTLMMKKLLSLLAILAIIFSSYCSRIEQNDDPIIGIWIEAVSSSEDNTAKSTTRKEWIFNDVYLGRYHEIDGSKIIEQTDFKWSQVDGIYTVEYRGLENKPNDIVTIKNTSEGALLEQNNGKMLAIRE